MRNKDLARVLHILAGLWLPLAEVQGAAHLMSQGLQPPGQVSDPRSS